NCSSMKSITIPKSVTYIGSYAVGLANNKVIDGFIIYGYKNTQAQTYATNNKITFKALQEETVLVGDVNNDGKVTVADVTYLQMYLAGNSSVVIKNTKAADANGDGKIDVADVTKIQTMLAS
ncbi:dockerin type I domain-containing protein, partial [Ruminococcus sp.]|uniref:dockerin type I repeat-containing protein n=1 Tax=Ruminococcus sp. TaxID=41978 RepID=UPI003862F3CA